MASCVKRGRLYYGTDPQLGEIRGLDPWAVDQGIHLLCMDKDAAEGILMIRENHRQQYSTVHGGMLAALTDTIAGHSLVPHGKMCVTQNCTVNFLKPAKGDVLFCKAVPIHVGHHICVVSTEVTDERRERLVTALFTFVVIKEVEPLSLPPELDAEKYRSR